jgi:N-carbamoylputrescine amidase
MKLALVQMTAGPDPEANRRRTAERVAEAAARGADVVALQELFSTIYFPQYMDPAYFDLAEPIPGPTSAWLSDQSRRHGITLIGSLYERTRSGVRFNTAVVFGPDGSLLGVSRKTHIPDDPGYTEKYYFTPGDSGHPVFETPVGTLAVPTCWDQWFPETARLVALKGARLIVYPTAIGSAPDGEPHPAQAHDAWETVMRGHAIANGVFVAAVNRVGQEGGIRFWGQSFVADPAGQVRARASADREEVLLVAFDLDREVDEARRMAPLWRDRRPETYGGLDRHVLPG